MAKAMQIASFRKVLSGARRRVLNLLSLSPLFRRLHCVAWHRPLDLLAWASIDPHSKLKEIRRPYEAQHPLPINISSKSYLPGLAPPWVQTLALRDVPNLPVQGAYIAELSDCWIVRTRYDWGGYQFCICNRHRQPLRFHGLVSDVRNQEMQKAVANATTSTARSLDEAIWIIGHWYNNYYHWFVEFLPRIALALEQGLPGNKILLPPLFGQWAWDSLGLIGLSPTWLEEGCSAWHVRRLTVISESPHHGKTHRIVRQMLTAKAPVQGVPLTKYWISRKEAVHRRLLEENEIEAWLIGRGWSVIRMEELSLQEQIHLMQGASAIAGLHGAGLTNIVFLPPVTPVLEIVVCERPCSEYYALASTLGHPYWYVSARAAGLRQSLVHDDVTVKVEEFREAVIGLENWIETKSGSLHYEPGGANDRRSETATEGATE